MGVDGWWGVIGRYKAKKWERIHSHCHLDYQKSCRELTHCGRVTQICVFNTVKLGTSASSP